MVTQDC